MSDVVTVTLRRIGSRYASSSFGLTAYGTTPYGGSAHLDEEFGNLELGSDIPDEAIPRTRGGIVHRRNGVPVAVRTDQVSGRLWRFSFIHPLAVLEQLRVYWNDRVFYLLPNGPDDPSPVTVVWDAPQFLPVLHSGVPFDEIYRLAATFEELVS
jgi:hypothetical protein